MSTNSPTKFVKPADLFSRMRQSSNSSPAFEQQSPLKCLNNLIDPSPTKKLPTLLRNPFNLQPVKRRLNLGSPNKRTKMFEIDEDANLEPPKMKQAKLINRKSCFKNDWSLRVSLRVNFEKQIQNWNSQSTSTHKRSANSPSKLNDKTISIEAIKNVTTVYQHPYLAWLPLYPRVSSEFTKDSTMAFVKNSEASKMMLRDWCESLNDLTNLLIDGKCPYFYLCSDTYNILFKQVPSSNPKRPTVQAFISPLFNSMGLEFNKLDIKFKCSDCSQVKPITTTTNNSNNRQQDNSSQHSFGSRTQSNNSLVDLDNCSQASSRQQGIRNNNNNNNNKTNNASSIDSGNGSDLEQDDSDCDEENGETSQIFLESIGITALEFPKLSSVKKKCIIDSDSNTQTKDSRKKLLAEIEGVDNVRKLVKFLQTNEKYIIGKLGRFACIPPTLLSPREFRLSTPQNPDVILKEINNKPENGLTTYLELKGTILPSIYDELHKLLFISNNTDHVCSSKQLELTSTFESIQFNS